LRLRYTMSTHSYFFKKDGLRQAYGYYTSTTRTEPYTPAERLDVLRSP
jgi:hypothetical protein